MRVKTMVAGLAFVLAACGGGEKNEAATPADTSAAVSEAPANAPAATGATHDVEMTMVNGQPRYVPDNITIKPGDVVVFHNKEGGPHNVAFYSDSIPSGGADHVQIPETMGPLTSQMAVEQDATIQVSFPDAPAGEYKFYCQPHVAQGMKGTITVQQ